MGYSYKSKTKNEDFIGTNGKSIDQFFSPNQTNGNPILCTVGKTGENYLNDVKKVVGMLKTLNYYHQDDSGYWGTQAHIALQEFQNKLVSFDVITKNDIVSTIDSSSIIYQMLVIDYEAMEVYRRLADSENYRRDDYLSSFDIKMKPGDILNEVKEENPMLSNVAEEKKATTNGIIPTRSDEWVVTSSTAQKLDYKGNQDSDVEQYFAAATKVKILQDQFINDELLVCVESLDGTKAWVKFSNLARSKDIVFDYVFDRQGKFVDIKNPRKKSNKIANRIVVVNSAENLKTLFIAGFNDSDIDTRLLRYEFVDDVSFNRQKSRLITIEPSHIEMVMDKNGSRSLGDESAFKYIERESRPAGSQSKLSGISKGELDHVRHSDYIPDTCSLYYIKGTDKVYNAKDFGNFLWGRAGREMGFDKLTLQGLAQLNNMLNGKTDNNDDSIPFLDSPTDQQAIIDGYNYNP
jgi:hypothetical protein